MNNQRPGRLSRLRGLLTRDKLSGYFSRLRGSLANDGHRMKVQFVSIYFILAVVSAFMTLVNIVTRRNALMFSTLAFSMANILNLLLSTRRGRCRQVAPILFSIEITALFTYFIVSGEPEGFSAIWVCMLPASGLLLFGKKRGSALCAVELGIMLFFFYLPFGRSLLRFRYTDSFLLRFPMLYLAFFAVAYLLEALRSATHDALQESKRQYQHLYSHDALTNVYNRYGFNERMDALLRAPRAQGVALLILDVDFFKNVNDRYGHTGGDLVLRAIAALLTQKSGARAAVCRWGGEEFAVILPDGADCERVAGDILRGIRALNVTIDGEPVRVTVSIGMVFAPASAPVSSSALLTQTDRCLYRAKAAGRDRVVSAQYAPQA